MKSMGAMMGNFPDRSSASSTIPRTPPQWSLGQRVISKISADGEKGDNDPRKSECENVA
jgi:hypothetical protein